MNELPTFQSLCLHICKMEVTSLLTSWVYVRVTWFRNLEKYGGE